MILISKFRTSASKKINLMVLIRTLTISTTAFDRMKTKFYGFQQTVMSFRYHFEALDERDFIFNVLWSKSLVASNPRGLK